MKFIYLTRAVVAAIAYAHPIDAIEFAGWELKIQLGPIANHGLTALAKHGNTELTGLAKRDNAEFSLYPTHDCSGFSIVLSPTHSGAAGNFSPAQQSIRIYKLYDGYHLNMYNGWDQSGDWAVLTPSQVGTDKCYQGNWVSYGLYSD
ncbi:hypothetical protein BJ170DRAFT_426458 [Xylariales sp. AK1849]|nr:hypothetical protein BJ170DRAFT_426458 [Xylariales sp. AK1849]